MSFSFDDAMRWTRLRDELKAGMSEKERSSWHERSAGAVQDFCLIDKCNGCPLCTLEGQVGDIGVDCMVITAARLTDYGLWQQARALCDRILEKFAED